jgi:hypothetical protein
LYSFVDLAFLLLIAMSQLDLDLRASVDLGEITIPNIVTSAATPLSADARERWQLRVHPPEDEAAGPFALVVMGAGAVDERIGVEALRASLDALQQERGPKPLLAPHKTSHSRDLLLAVALLEERWPSRRSVILAPEEEASAADSLPAVSAGP